MEWERTTGVVALIAAYRRRGLVVQPFNCTPDFIDGGHHTRASGRASCNLDGWIFSVQENREIFPAAAERLILRRRGSHGSF